MVRAEELRTTVWPRSWCPTHHLTHVGIDALGDAILEEVLPQLVEFGQRFSSQISGRPDEEALERHPADPVANRGFEDSENLTGRGLPPPDAVTGVRRGGEAVHQCAVEVEEGPHLRPTRTRSDFVQRLGWRQGAAHGASTPSRHRSRPVEAGKKRKI